MKKIINIVLFVALLLGTTSCTDLLDPSLRNAGQVIPEGATLTIGFGVPAEVSTKAASMASTPTIESIHVFVFDDEGTLLQVRKATVGNTVTANYDENNVTSAMTSSWYVDNILMSAEKRVLHFVANLADDQIPTSGSETSIFQSLAVTEPNAAYWQRIELDNILPYKYKGGGKYSYVDDNGEFQQNQNVNGTMATDGSGSYTDENNFIVNVGDYIDRQSRKIVNGTGYYADETVSAKVKLVPLVRNFARIEFTNSWSSFTLKKIALAYEPKAGLVAPFNAGFATEYVNLTPGQEPNMNSSTYTPLLPAAGVNTECPTNFTNVTDNHATLFIYERGIPTANATCVLIGGVLTGASASEKDSEGNTWFKIEITDLNGAYFKIYRDCTYEMTVSSIENPTKYPSAQAAFDAAPIGDLSNSPETATLTQITDGNGLTLWVNYIDHVDMTGGNTVPLLYTFFYENGNDVSYFPGKVTFTREKHPNSTLGWATTETVTKYTTPLTSSSPYYSQIPDRNYNWYLAEVTLNSKGNEILQSDIVVKGAVTTADGVPRNMTLTRRVAYTVMDQQELGLDASPIATDAAGNQTIVTITLPNTLGPSVFPLTLKIEAEDNNLTPIDNLTVETGPSSFNPNKNSYYFLKTISYTEYQALASASYTFTCAFKTTKATGKTPVTKIRVIEKLAEGETRDSLFKGGDDATVDLKVGPAFIISSSGVSVGANKTSATFTITSTGEENTTWTLTPSDNITSLSANPSFSTDYSGSGNATITVNFPANTNTSAPATYTVTAHREGFSPDRVFTITQAKAPYYTINLNAGDDNTNNGYPWVSSTVNPNTNTYWSYQSNNEGQNSRIATMSVTVVGYTEFTVYIRSYAESGYDFVTVRSLGGNAMTSWDRGTASGSGAKASTRYSNNGSGTDYAPVTFTTSDGLTDDDTPHTFYIQYGKDYSGASGDDRGYVLIPKTYNQQ